MAFLVGIPIMAAIGIGESGLIGDGQPNTALFETNIDFGPERTSLIGCKFFSTRYYNSNRFTLAAFIVRSRKRKSNYLLFLLSFVFWFISKLF